MNKPAALEILAKEQFNKSEKREVLIEDIFNTVYSSSSVGIEAEVIKPAYLELIRQLLKI